MPHHPVARRLAFPAVMALAALTLAARPAQIVSRVSDINERAHQFRSPALDRTIKYIVVSPAETRGPGPFPVLYLLHGYGGDETNWTARAHAGDLVRDADLIVVMSDGENSWYVNGANGERWQDAVVTDLVADVESWLPVRHDRAARAIAGLSMGGYGAVRIALTFPDRYALAMSFSGAFDITRENSVFSGRSRPDVVAVFGEIGSQTRQDTDVYRIVAQAASASAPYLYLACGTSDPWLEPNREMDRALASRGIVHEYHESAGGHDWTFWSGQVSRMLDVMRERHFVN